MIKYGWHSAHGKQLFVWENKDKKGITSWGVTNDFNEGKPFSNINDCINHWLAKHRFPEQYSHLINEGHLQFFEAKTKQQILFFTI